MSYGTTMLVTTFFVLGAFGVIGGFVLSSWADKARGAVKEWLRVFSIMAIIAGVYALSTFFYLAGGGSFGA